MWWMWDFSKVCWHFQWFSRQKMYQVHLEKCFTIDISERHFPTAHFLLLLIFLFCLLVNSFHLPQLITRIRKTSAEFSAQIIYCFIWNIKQTVISFNCSKNCGLLELKFEDKHHLYEYKSLCGKNYFKYSILFRLLGLTARAIT